VDNGQQPSPYFIAIVVHGNIERRACRPQLPTSHAKGKQRAGERAIPKQQRLRGARLRYGPAGLVAVQPRNVGARWSLISDPSKRKVPAPSGAFSNLGAPTIASTG